MGARIQPNSPTDDPEDIVMQVLDGWSYAVGDVVLGTNPVSSDVDQVAAIEMALRDLLATFELEDGAAALRAGARRCAGAGRGEVPGIDRAVVPEPRGRRRRQRRVRHRRREDAQRMRRSAPGASACTSRPARAPTATNGHGKGFDMVIHESRKYGFARALKPRWRERARDGRHAGRDRGFTSTTSPASSAPRSSGRRTQLVRVCLEDTVMGKLHGLTIGLDICSTLHMEVTLDDLDWCIEQVMPANPAYLMALPTKNDPMLSYLTTAFQDHVRVREKFGYKVDDRMWAFFQKLGVIDADGRPTAHFGDPRWVYLQYRRARRDARTGRRDPARRPTRQSRACAAAACSSRRATAPKPSDMDPALDQQVRRALRGRQGLHPRGASRELPGDARVRRAGRDAQPRSRRLHPAPADRRDAGRAVAGARDGASRRAARHATTCRLSWPTGSTRYALTDAGHLAPYLDELRRGLLAGGFRPAPEHLVVTSGRVRAGYRIGEMLFGGLAPDGAGGGGPRHRRAARQRAPHVLGLRHQAAGARVGDGPASSITTTPE